jgi:predicted acyltransferase
VQRNASLDTLRGFAIFTMILSGSIAYGDALPAWMYHAQVPPPLHDFNPKLPGITWVDLVFPFFLFSMGAAIPLALQKKELTTKKVVFSTLKRFVLLAFFALFFNHLKAWVIAENPSWKEEFISVGAFILLLFLLIKIKKKLLEIITKLVVFIIAILLLYYLPFHKGKGFDLYKSDIIIMVLANMALFGTLIYWFTQKIPLVRVGVLLFIMAIFLSAKEPIESWQKTLFNFNAIGNFKIDWLYKFYFLKYLFIILPGTVVGEWMVKSTLVGTGKARQTLTEKVLKKDKHSISICILICYILFCNLFCLFNRYLVANVIVTSILLFLLNYVVKRTKNRLLYKNLVQLGAYLLLLGLCFEAYEGGIKKDSSTYSYYFVTSGLACLVILFFDIATYRKYFNWLINPLTTVGKNPLMAYMMGSLLVLPLLHVTGLYTYWNAMHTNPFIGFLKGLLFTLLVCIITNIFTKYKVILKT